MYIVYKYICTVLLFEPIVIPKCIKRNIHNVYALPIPFITIRFYLGCVICAYGYFYRGKNVKLI